MDRFLKLILVILFAAGCWGNASAQLYVVYTNAGLISEYDADSGALINETFILGLHQPRGLCLTDGMLYVAQTGNGTVGKYDARTGATINEQLITGLRLPQAITVAGNVLFVSDFNETGRPRLGKYNAVTGATMSPSFVPNLKAPVGLAVSGNKLFVACSDGLGGVLELDATNGAVIEQKFARGAFEPEGLALWGDWIWITNGANAPWGAVFKVNVDTGASAVGLGFYHPLITKLDYPTRVAVSGDDLYVGTGDDTGVAKYNATTGKLINAKFVPPLADRLGGLAAVPRTPSNRDVLADYKFAVKNSVADFAFVLLMNGNYLFLCVGVAVTLVVVGLFALLFRRKGPALAEPAPARAEAVQPALAPAADPEGLPPQAAVEQPASEQPPPAKSHSMSVLAIVGIIIFVITVVAAAVMGYFAYQWAITSYLEYVQRGGSPVPK